MTNLALSYLELRPSHWLDRPSVCISIQEVVVAPPESAAVSRHHSAEGNGVCVQSVQAPRPPGGHLYSRGRWLWTSRAGETAHMFMDIHEYSTSIALGCKRYDSNSIYRQQTFWINVYSLVSVYNMKLQNTFLKSEPSFFRSSSKPPIEMNACSMDDFVLFSHDPGLFSTLFGFDCDSNYYTNDLNPFLARCKRIQITYFAVTENI